MYSISKCQPDQQKFTVNFTEYWYSGVDRDRCEEKLSALTNALYYNNELDWTQINELFWSDLDGPAWIVDTIKLGDTVIWKQQHDATGIACHALHCASRPLAKLQTIETWCYVGWASSIDIPCIHCDGQRILLNEQTLFTTKVIAGIPLSTLEDELTESELERVLSYDDGSNCGCYYIAANGKPADDETILEMVRLITMDLIEKPNPLQIHLFPEEKL